MDEDFSVLNREAVKHVRKKAKISGDSPEDRRAILEAILDMSRGVRTQRYEMASWLR